MSSAKNILLPEEIRMKSIKAIVIICLAAICLSTLSPALHAGKCEDAFFSCINDPINMILMTGKTNCAAGYLFCKKYIEPLTK
jgi:hypothetical protein